MSKVDSTEYNTNWKTQQKSFHFFIGGELSVETSIASTFATMPLRIINVLLGVDTAPNGQPIICDVNKNGTSIFSTKPSIAAGATSGTYAVTSTISTGDTISIDLDQVGSTIKGTNLRLVIICEVI